MDKLTVVLMSIKWLNKIERPLDFSSFMIFTHTLSLSHITLISGASPFQGSKHNKTYKISSSVSFQQNKQE